MHSDDESGRSFVTKRRRFDDDDPTYQKRAGRYAPLQPEPEYEQWEMELMNQAGLTPMQIITDATHNAAEFLQAKDLGTLQRGKWADLIVLDKNPLENIRNTRSIEMVMIAGNKI